MQQKTNMMNSNTKYPNLPSAQKGLDKHKMSPGFTATCTITNKENRRTGPIANRANLYK